MLKRLDIYTIKILTAPMGRMCFVIDDSLESDFRETIYKRMGMKKGNIQIAIEEAMKDWINKNHTRSESQL
jgi:hypothetical protein